MPIYEYECTACHHRFEALVFGGRTPACPACGTEKPTKRFSAFAVGAGGGPRSGSACPAPAPGGG